MEFILWMINQTSSFIKLFLHVYDNLLCLSSRVLMEASVMNTCTIISLEAIHRCRSRIGNKLYSLRIWLSNICIFLLHIYSHWSMSGHEDLWQDEQSIYSWKSSMYMSRIVQYSTAYWFLNASWCTYFKFISFSIESPTIYLHRVLWFHFYFRSDLFTVCDC